MKEYVIKWTNKISREEGFVQDIVSKERHFVNTPDKSKAKKFYNKGLAVSAIKRLVEMGESQNNELEAVEI